MIDSKDALLIASRSPEAALVRRVLRRRLPEPARILVAVSGGYDSTALLLLSAAIANRGNEYEVVVGHVDHGLRPESGTEATHVASLADWIGVRHLVRRLEVDGSTSGAALRRHRWDALEEMAMSLRAGAVLTGHHALDQAETVLLRLARGTGLAGLAGIPESRRTRLGVQVIRPLLEVERSTLERLVDAVGWTPTDDPTNARRDLARGLVRHEIIPRLERLHPGAATRMAATAREIAQIQAASPSQSRTIWPREVCRSMGEERMATEIRAAVRARLGRTVDGVSRPVWHSAARAAVDDQMHPRGIEVLPGCRVEIDARDVRLSFPSEEPSA